MSAGAARGIRAGAAFVEISLNNAALTKGLQQASRQMARFGQSVSSVGRQMTALAATVAVPAAIATNTFASFDDKMREVAAVTGAVDKEFQNLTDTAKELGRTTSFTAQEVAAGMAELGRAGLSANEIISAIPDTLNLARATSTDLGRAAEITAVTMRQFGLAAGDTTEIVDTLTRTANGSAQTLEDLAEGLKTSAPLAAESGESLESVSRALALLANNGIKGSLASNALARAFKNLSDVNVRNKIAELIPGQDVQIINKATGAMLPLEKAITNIGKATEGLGNADRLNVFNQVFGRASAAALKLGQSGAFDKINAQFDNMEMTAKSVAKEMDAGIGGAFRRLVSAVEGVALAFGNALAPVLTDIAEKLAGAAGKITEFIDANKELIVDVVKGVAAFGAIGIALLGIGSSISAAGFAFGGLGTIVATLAVAIKTIGVAFAAILSPVGLAVGAIVGGLVLLETEFGVFSAVLNTLTSYAEEQWRRFAGFADEAIGGIADALRAGDIQKASEILWASVMVLWEKGVLEVKNLFVDLETAVVTAFDQVVLAAEVAADQVLQFWGTSVRELIDLITNFDQYASDAWDNLVMRAEVAANEVLGYFGLSIEGITAALETLRSVADSVFGYVADVAKARFSEMESAADFLSEQVQDSLGGRILARLGRAWDELGDYISNILAEVRAEVAKFFPVLAALEKALDSAFGSGISGEFTNEINNLSDAMANAAKENADVAETAKTENQLALTYAEQRLALLREEARENRELAEARSETNKAAEDLINALGEAKPKVKVEVDTRTLDQVAEDVMESMGGGAEEIAEEQFTPGGIAVEYLEAPDVTTAGTFSAIESLLGGIVSTTKPEEEIAAFSKQTAKNTKRIEEAILNQGNISFGQAV